MKIFCERTSYEYQVTISLISSNVEHLLYICYYALRL
nr:MAG TPA: hypothetical protein [Caudoviricetes sp.]